MISMNQTDLNALLAAEDIFWDPDGNHTFLKLVWFFYYIFLITPF